MDNKMPDKICLHLLILCGIWSLGITGTFGDEDIRESSDILIRQKRVINRIDDTTTPIINVPYVVRIRLHLRVSCVASILSHYVAITSTLCALQEETVYQVISSKAHLDKGTLHNVTNIRRKFGNHPLRPTDGIALLVVHPPFVYDAYTNNIQLHSETLLPGIFGLVSGWGYNCRTSDHGTIYPRSLRSIEVPIIAHRECVNIYRPHQIEISDRDICTYHPQKHCGHNDGGAPLVVNGYLAGVHLWTGPDREPNDHRFPDVFALLQDSEYNQWISTNMRNIQAEFQHHH